MFDIDITEDAIEDMRVFREFDRRRIFDGIETQLGVVALILQCQICAEFASVEPKFGRFQGRKAQIVP